MAKYMVNKQTMLYGDRLYLYGETVEVSGGTKIPDGLELIASDETEQAPVKSKKSKGKRAADIDPF